MQFSGWTQPLSHISEGVATSPATVYVSASSGVANEKKAGIRVPACPAPIMMDSVVIPVMKVDGPDDARSVQSMRSSGDASQNARAAELKAKRAELRARRGHRPQHV